MTDNRRGQNGGCPRLSERTKKMNYIFEDAIDYEKINKPSELANDLAMKIKHILFDRMLENNYCMICKEQVDIAYAIDKAIADDAKSKKEACNGKQ